MTEVTTGFTEGSCLNFDTTYKIKVSKIGDFEYIKSFGMIPMVYFIGLTEDYLNSLKEHYNYSTPPQVLPISKPLFDPDGLLIPDWRYHLAGRLEAYPPIKWREVE